VGVVAEGREMGVVDVALGVYSTMALEAPRTALSSLKSVLTGFPYI